MIKEVVKMAGILISGGRVFNGECFYNADLLIKEGIIQKIEQNITESADFVFNAGGKIVSPGNIDIHAHIRHINSDKYGAPADAVCLPFGVTAVVDSAAEKGNKDVLDLFSVNTLVFAKTTIINDTANLENAKNIIKTYGERCIGVKIFFDNGNKELKSIKPLKEVCAFARYMGLKVMVHCTNSPASMQEIIETLSPGDILTHAYHGGENTIEEENFSAYHKAKEKGVILDLGMAGFTHIDYEILRRAVNKGFLPDTISTDITKNSMMRRGGRYSLTQCMNMARTLGMGEEEVFRAVTSTPAKAIGMWDEWGRLKEGGRADVAVFEYADEGFSITDKYGHHIESVTGYHCLLTIINGEIVFRR